MENNLNPGEEFKVLQDYDLFGSNVRGKNGIFVSIGTNGKLLLFFREENEWAEIDRNNLERINPQKVTSKNKKFIKLVKKMP